MKKTALAALLSLGLLAAAHAAGERAAVVQNASGNPFDLMYLPEGKVLRVASLGYRSFLADLVWLRTIQYYGEQRLTTRNYDQAERLFQVIYDLDPHFKGATRFGALVLSQDAGNPQGAIALLARASADDPRAWEYPFDQGFIYHTVLCDYAKAGAAYRKAAGLPGAPELAQRLAGASFAKLGDRVTAREIWHAIEDEAANDMTRQLAERNLKNIDLDEMEETLTDGVQRFSAKEGRVPANWEELVRTGYVAKVPKDPWGGGFYWDAGTSKVYSSTTVDRRMAVARDLFADRVKLYVKRRGALPPSLDAVVDEGLMQTPWKPFGLSLDYDARTGSVAWNPPWPATEPGMHGVGGTAS